MGEVNYKEHQPEKRKPYQIYHVNLVKLWRDREQVSAMVGVESGDPAGLDLVQFAATLSKPQTQQAKEFLQGNWDMFSGLPGLTNAIEHDIVTEPNVKIWLKPYHIPEAHRVAVSEEVKRMLELEVTEELESEWSSPILLVPKPNGTLCFCNDFRKLNEVFKFDAYPIPHGR